MSCSRPVAVLCCRDPLYMDYEIIVSRTDDSDFIKYYVEVVANEGKPFTPLIEVVLAPANLPLECYATQRRLAPEEVPSHSREVNGAVSPDGDMRVYRGSGRSADTVCRTTSLPSSVWTFFLPPRTYCFVAGLTTCASTTRCPRTSSPALTMS